MNQLAASGFIRRGCSAGKQGCPHTSIPSFHAPACSGASDNQLEIDLCERTVVAIDKVYQVVDTALEMPAHIVGSRARIPRIPTDSTPILHQVKLLYIESVV